MAAEVRPSPEGDRELDEHSHVERTSEGAEKPGDDRQEPGMEVAQRVDLPGVSIDYTVTEEGEEFVLILQATLSDIALPYELDVVTGSRITIPDPPVSTTEALPTLLFLTYPYLRETVSNFTARSPYPATFLPPLTRLPHPSVIEAEQSE